MVVSYSIFNSSNQPVEVVPPQIQITGHKAEKKNKREGKGIISDQLQIRDYRLSDTRLEPGGRADGVVVFDRPNFKQANEWPRTLGNAGDSEVMSLAANSRVVVSVPADTNIYIVFTKHEPSSSTLHKVASINPDRLCFCLKVLAPYARAFFGPVFDTAPGLRYSRVACRVLNINWPQQL